jgi:2-isopropylmalate synthase
MGTGPGCKLDTNQNCYSNWMKWVLTLKLVSVSSPGDFLSVSEISKVVKKCHCLRINKSSKMILMLQLRHCKKRPRIHTGIGTSESHIVHNKYNKRDIIARAKFAALCQIVC